MTPVEQRVGQAGLPESEYIMLLVDWHPAWAGWARSGAEERCPRALGGAEESCRLEMRGDWAGLVSGKLTVGRGGCVDCGVGEGSSLTRGKRASESSLASGFTAWLVTEAGTSQGEVAATLSLSTEPR